MLNPDVCLDMDHLLPIVLLIVAVLLVIVARKLTVTGGMVGGLIACGIYTGAGYAGIAMLGTFFLLGVLATHWKRKEKELRAGVEPEANRRTAGQVLANGGVAALTGLGAYLFPDYAVLMNIAMAGSLAAATADTLSSELGMVYGRRFVNAITWKEDVCGENGVISLEGTLIGVAGCTVIAAIYCFDNGLDISFLWIVVAGTAGNWVDSIAGATIERKELVGNNLVNTLNTTAGALTAIALEMIW